MALSLSRGIKLPSLPGTPPRCCVHELLAAPLPEFAASRAASKTSRVLCTPSTRHGGTRVKFNRNLICLCTGARRAPFERVSKTRTQLMVQSSRSRRPEAAEASRSPGKADFMRFWTARRRRGAAARQLRRTNASWHLPFCASLSLLRNCFFFDNAWICRFDCQGLFSKEKPGTSLTVTPRAAKNAETTISSTTLQVGSRRAAMAA